MVNWQHPSPLFDYRNSKNGTWLLLPQVNQPRQLLRNAVGAPSIIQFGSGEA